MVEILYKLTVQPAEQLLGLNASQFNFSLHGSVFQDLRFVVAMLVLYVTMVFTLPKFVSKSGQPSTATVNGKAVKAAASKDGERYTVLNTLFLAHNVILSAGSLLLLGLILENLVPRAINHGLMWAFCHHDSFEDDKRIQLFYFVNYLFKYYEFIDTIFMILKGKRVPFLHWFHHAMTMLLCFTQLQGRTALQWVPITINLFVHVIMYYYYAITSIPPPPNRPRKVIWWKRHLTTMQIVQFVIDVVVINYCLWVGINHRYPVILKNNLNYLNQFAFNLIPVDAIQYFLSPTWETLGRGLMPNNPLVLGGYVYEDRAGCYGDLVSGVFALLVINSYLILFIQFFIETYFGGKKAASAGVSKKKGE
ncbi:hypothetical protein MIR68_002276 [Amoeboaphelidium protococcarum]|nr:hypothetical protein MIR68_002276 [Amoeboaphelidium protococcarum]